MITRSIARTASAAVLAAALALGACGGNAAGTTAATTTVADAAGTSADTSAGSDVATDAGVQQVDANTASIDELAAAFEANGISSASRWAYEVDEYRPYDTADTTFGELRQELSKYNPSDDVLEAIIGSLTL